LDALLKGVNRRGQPSGLNLHQQALDTSTSSGRALLGMLGVFSEFERAMIRDRVMAGLDRARASGKRLGRPRTTPYTIRHIQAALNEGRGVREIARLLKVSPARGIGD
jgi:DNA invertase Pin-like site-specific DNA recombinase